jgi:hypothetical protein
MCKKKQYADIHPHNITLKYKTAHIPIKAQTERIYTHKGRGFAGIFSGCCAGNDVPTEGIPPGGGAE